MNLLSLLASSFSEPISARLVIVVALSVIGAAFFFWATMLFATHVVPGAPECKRWCCRPRPSKIAPETARSIEPSAQVPAVVPAPLRAGYKYCPQCTTLLVMANADGKQRLKCTRCPFVHWDNPKGVSIVVIPAKRADGSTGLVLIKRKVEPRAGMHALPGGFIDSNETPEEGARREALEETGLVIELDRLLATKAPAGVNQMLFFYLAKPVDVAPQAGDDAEEAAIYCTSEIPNTIAFATHKEVIAEWLAESSK